MLRPRRRYQPPPLYRRSITTPRVLMALAAVAAVAGIVVLLGHHSSSTKASEATTTSSGFGGIPNGAASSTSDTTGAGGALGVGAWCNQLYLIQYQASPIGFYIQANDLSGFRSAVDDLVPKIDRVAQQAPAGVHDAMAKVAAAADNLLDAVNKATSFDAATTQLSNALLPAIQNGAPAIAWIQANCPTNPNTTTTTSTSAPAPPS